MKLRAKPGARITLGVDIKEKHCECGSGKLAPECCNRHAIKHFELQVSADTINSSDGLAISPDGRVMRLVKGKLKPLTGIRNLKVFNRRIGKRDKLTAVSIAETDQQLNPDLQLFQFVHALVIDTNIRTDGSTTRCATGIFQVNMKGKSSEAASLGYKPVLTVEFVHPTLPPERIGWLFAIDAIKNSPHLTDKRIALISDHDASRHDCLNSRSQKIDGRMKLPKNMRLIYASTDRGNHAINKLMRKADQLVSRILDQGSPEETSPWIEGSEFHCETYRLSYPNPKNGNWAIAETDSVKYVYHPDGF